MRRSTVEKLLDTWKERLRLQNWTILLEMVPGNVGTTGDKGDVDAVGSIDWEPEFLCASIRIDKTLDPEQIERTLIHELVHLSFSGHTRESGYDVNEERAVESISEALYFGWRGRHKKAK